MDALRKVPQLVDREGDLGFRRLQDRGGPVGRLLGVFHSQSKAEGKRGQALLGSVMEIVLEPPPLGVGCLDEPGAGCAEPLGEPLTLRDHGREAQCRQGRYGDEQLRDQDAVGDRLICERTRVVRGVPRGEADDDGNRERRAALPEAQRRPDQRREHEV